MVEFIRDLSEEMDVMAFAQSLAIDDTTIESEVKPKSRNLSPPYLSWSIRLEKRHKDNTTFFIYHVDMPKNVVTLYKTRKKRLILQQILPWSDTIHSTKVGHESSKRKQPCIKILDLMF